MGGPRRVRLASVMVGMVILALSLAVVVLSVRLSRLSAEAEILRNDVTYANAMYEVALRHLKEELGRREAAQGDGAGRAGR